MKYYLADAFTDGPFSGGQTMVCEVPAWPGEKVMTSIAAEFAVDCTSFVIRRDGFFDLRWFTPEGEQGNMKYALVGAAKVLMEKCGTAGDGVVFETPNGRFEVRTNGEELELTQKAIEVSPYPLRPDMIEALSGAVPKETYKGRDLIFLFASEDEVRALQPDFAKLEQLPEGIACFAAAPGERSDIAARAFWPKIGICEDVVCGSMYANLAPLFARMTGKTELTARQLGVRKSFVALRVNADGVTMRGRAAVAAEGELLLPLDKEA